MRLDHGRRRCRFRRKFCWRWSRRRCQRCNFRFRRSVRAGGSRWGRRWRLFPSGCCRCARRSVSRARCLRGARCRDRDAGSRRGCGRWARRRDRCGRTLRSGSAGLRGIGIVRIDRALDTRSRRLAGIGKAIARHRTSILRGRCSGIAERHDHGRCGRHGCRSPRHATHCAPHSRSPDPIRRRVPCLRSAAARRRLNAELTC